MNTPPDGSVRPGEIIAGKYRVERVLGTGAMGVVVAALHIDLHERRAIKFMLPSMLDDHEGVERFMREARSAVRLKSQHVAKIHDIGRLENGAPYMVMEYLEGQDLKHTLDARGALTIPEAVTWMMQVCEAIAEAHHLGIVHRDLKPANLYLTRDVRGAVCLKVLDFGIAKLIGGDDAVDMTRTSMLLGTPLYMSPEQMRGSKSVDGRSDIWALGAILYRMLTNRTPFAGSSVTEICAAVVADTPDPPAMLRPDLPPGLEAAVMRCLEKNPARRFATAGELAQAIAPFAHARQPGAFAAAPPPHAPRDASHPSFASNPALGHGYGAAGAAGSSSQPFAQAAPPAQPRAAEQSNSQNVAVARTQTGTVAAPVSLPSGVGDLPIDGSLAASTSHSRAPAVIAAPPAKGSRAWLFALGAAALIGGGVGVFFVTRGSGAPSGAGNAAQKEPERATAEPSASARAAAPPAIDVAPAPSAPAVASADTSASAAPAASSAPAVAAATPPQSPPPNAMVGARPTAAPPPTPATKPKPPDLYDKRN